MKTLFIHKDNDLQLTARFEDSTNVLSINGTWKAQKFGMSIPAKGATLNSIDVNQLQAIVNNSEIFVCAELSEYDKDLIQLHEQCRKGGYHSYGLFCALDRLAAKHKCLSQKIIADLFAC